MIFGKSLICDGIVLEFYKVFWSMLGAEYIVMINESIQEGRLPPGVTQGMIALCIKGETDMLSRTGDPLLYSAWITRYMLRPYSGDYNRC